MLIAQALGEYGALGSLSDGLQSASVRVEELAAQWGVEGVVIVVLAFVLWRAITAVR